MHSKIDVTAYLLTAGFILFLVLFGWKVHFIEVPNSAEMDGYVGNAEQILSGKIPRDPYHPLLYPILSAAAGALTGNAFSGARVISTFCAGLFALMTYLVGRQCFGRGVGLLSLIAMIVNYNVITMGMDAASDMAFSALALLVLFLAIRISSGLSYTVIALLALAGALAFFTRYSASFLLPTIVLALFFSLSKATARERVLGSAIFVCTTIIFLIPHFVLTARIFGSPFYNESWRNLALKMYSDYDWSYFRSAPFDGTMSVVLSSPLKLFTTSLRELARFFYGTLAELGGKGLAGGLFAASALMGFYCVLFSPGRRRLILISFAFFIVILNCIFFYSGPRFMLPVLPLCYLWGGSFLLSGPFAGYLHIGNRRVPRSAPVIAVSMLALALTTAAHMRMYVAAHPVRELEAARSIERTYGANVTVLGTFPFMQRYVKYRYYELEDAVRDEITRPDLYMNRLKIIVEEKNADFLIIGKLFLRNRPLGLLEGDDAPSFLEPFVRSADVVVYRIRKGPLD